MKPISVTIGADPEFFLATEQNKEDGERNIIPACGRVGGGKKNAIMLSPDGGYLEDGPVVEFNVSPSKTLEETASKIRTLMAIFQANHKNYKLVMKGSHKFTKEELAQNPAASVLGCEPDLYAWGLRERPQANMMGQYRFAGGHIHIGLDPWPANLEKEEFIKFLDICWLLPYLRSFDARRLPFYGHPGLYRETPYGVEYRSPDAIWITSKPIAASFDALISKFVHNVHKSDGAMCELIPVVIDKMGTGRELGIFDSSSWSRAPGRIAGNGWKDYLLAELGM